MIWKGETENQRFLRLNTRGERVFALFPTKMDDGTWVWLEKYWRFAAGVNRKHCTYRRGISIEDTRPKSIKRPPPPKFRGGSHATPERNTK